MSTMKHNGLTQLPKELLIHIATYCDALSALRLSTTCRTIRSACYDKLVFKQIIARSSDPPWVAPLDRIEAAASRLQRLPCGTAADHHATQAWTRYALADHQATLLALGDCHLESTSLDPTKFSRFWLPALAVLNHPSLQHQVGSSYLRDAANDSTGQAFSLAMGLLTTESPTPMLTMYLERFEPPRLTQSSDCSRMYLWTLCSAVATIRSKTARQRAAWPYGAMARLPHIALPSAANIPFGDAIAPPLPFMQESIWDTWYRDHNTSLCTPEYFTTGTWCGYYTYLSNGMSHLDPPMLDITFEHFDSESDVSSVTKLRATGCRDGVGPFSIFGGVETADLGNGRARSIFAARKVYRHITTWMWELEVMPFGLVGFWGSPERGDVGGGGKSLRRHGMVWLWKEDWTKDQAG